MLFHKARVPRLQDDAPKEENDEKAAVARIVEDHARFSPLGELVGQSGGWRSTTTPARRGPTSVMCSVCVGNALLAAAVSIINQTTLL